MNILVIFNWLSLENTVLDWKEEAAHTHERVRHAAEVGWKLADVAAGRSGAQQETETPAQGAGVVALGLVRSGTRFF